MGTVAEVIGHANQVTGGLAAWSAAPDEQACTVFLVHADGKVWEPACRLWEDLGHHVEGVALADLSSGPPRVGIGCVIVDLDAEGGSGHDVLVQLRARGWAHPVVLVSGRATIPAVVKAMRAGATDFIAKPVDPVAIVAVAEEAMLRHRRTMADAAVIAARRARFDHLSARERQVALGIARGQLNKQVAHDLGLTLATIKFHRARALTKLGVRCVPELVLLLQSLDALPALIGPVTTR